MALSPSQKINHTPQARRHSSNDGSPTVPRSGAAVSTPSSGRPGSTLTPVRFSNLASFWRVRADGEDPDVATKEAKGMQQGDPSAQSESSESRPALSGSGLTTRASTSTSTASTSISSRLSRAGFQQLDATTKSADVSAALLHTKKVHAAASPLRVRQPQRENQPTVVEKESVQMSSRATSANSSTPTSGRQSGSAMESSASSSATPGRTSSSPGSMPGVTRRRLQGSVAVSTAAGVSPGANHISTPSPAHLLGSPQVTSGASKSTGKTACTSIATPDTNLHRNEGVSSSPEHDAWLAETEMEIALELVNHMAPDVVDRLIETLRAADDARCAAEERAASAAAAVAAMASAGHPAKAETASTFAPRSSRRLLLVVVTMLLSACFIPGRDLTSAVQSLIDLATTAYLPMQAEPTQTASEPDLTETCIRDEALDVPSERVLECERVVVESRNESEALRLRRDGIASGYNFAMEKMSIWLGFVRDMRGDIKNKRVASGALGSDEEQLKVECLQAAQPGRAAMKSLLANFTPSAAPDLAAAMRRSRRALRRQALQRLFPTLRFDLRAQLHQKSVAKAPSPLVSAQLAQDLRFSAK